MVNLHNTVMQNCNNMVFRSGLELFTDGSGTFYEGMRVWDPFSFLIAISMGIAIQ